MGYIYMITNKLDGNKYIGQTSRDIDTRFAEHCSETRGHSKLHNAIQKYGWQNFKVEEIEEVPNNKLDEREQYWIQHYNTYHNGYNLTLGGFQTNINISNIKAIRVIENNIVVRSKEELSRLLSEVTSWRIRTISAMLRDAIDNNKDFLGYHFEQLIVPSEDYFSDENVVIDWIKTLNARYSGKHIHCIELDKDFSTIAEAAQYLLANNLYQTSSKTPIQSIVTSISNNLRGKTNGLNGVNGSLNFIYIPGTTKKVTTNSQPFAKKKIYCPQISKTFNSQTEAAQYMIDNNLWSGIKLKTAKLRISDIIRGAFQDYKGYTFKGIEENI